MTWLAVLLVFSPPAIDFGSSGVVKVSGQNCFRTLYGSLGQIRLGLPKGFMEGSLITSFLNSFLYFSPPALVLGSPPGGQNDKTFFGVFPKQIFTLVWQSPALFWANGCCFRKGSVEGSANYSMHLSPKWLLLQKQFFGGSVNCALHLSTSLFSGSKLCELLTCLNHANPVRRKRPIMSLLFGFSLGSFFFSMFFKSLLAFKSHLVAFLFATWKTSVVMRISIDLLRYICTQQRSKQSHWVANHVACLGARFAKIDMRTYSKLTRYPHCLCLTRTNLAVKSFHTQILKLLHSLLWVFFHFEDLYFRMKQIKPLLTFAPFVSIHHGITK